MTKVRVSVLVLLALTGGLFMYLARVNPRPTPVVQNTVATVPSTRTTAASTTSMTSEQSLATSTRLMEQLVAAYPDFLKLDPNDSNVVVWKQDGIRMQFDDGLPDKDLATMLVSPDLEDQMVMPYPTTTKYTISNDFDPGRVRYEPFFTKMYGSTSAAVQANLVTIHWLPHFGNQPLLVTRINGVDKKLQAVSDELDQLLEEPGNQYLLKYLKNPGGTFDWRNIAGTNRLSPHSFGIAIDINSANSDYWHWATGSGATYHNQVPLVIVQIFEKHGFIWGGKWYHFDTMHFEYRPELVPASL